VRADEMGMDPCCPGRTVTKRMTIGGREVGIAGLDEILEVGFSMGLSPEKAVREAMMRELKRNNYVPKGAEAEYEEGVWAAFAEVRERRMRGLPDREPKCRCGETGPGAV
jgi:hypothetical protein